MKKMKSSNRGKGAGSGDLFPSDLHGIHVSEARAQVGSHKAEAIREDWANITSDADLLLKLVEARYARETSAPCYDLQIEHQVLKQQAMRELLRKAALEGPVHPPKHARFAVFLLPRAYQHIIFGDLEEQYPLWVEECGQLRATFLYWWQFLLSTAVLAWPRMRRWRYLAVVLWVLLQILKTWR